MEAAGSADLVALLTHLSGLTQTMITIYLYFDSMVESACTRQ
jgi:hypothetical protein